MNEVVSIDELLRLVRRDAIMRKAIDPTAPDPDVFVGRLRELAQRYPPTQKDDGYDFMPLVRGAAIEYGLDEQVVAENMRAAEKTLRANS